MSSSGNSPAMPMAGMTGMPAGENPDLDGRHAAYTLDQLNR
jgi:hypothetical protein